MSDTSLDFVHRFVPGGVGPTPTLLLLHGTGGDESDLLPLGGALAPGAALLSPRGKVLERGMPRFFRRLAEGVFDLEDLRFRTHQLARFVRAAASRYGFTLDSLYAIGFSNGRTSRRACCLSQGDVDAAREWLAQRMMVGVRRA